MTDSALAKYLNAKAMPDDGRVRLDISFEELEELRAALAAQPASPLRGGEIDAVARCMEILEDVPGENLIDRVHRIVDWHRQLSEQYYALSNTQDKQPLDGETGV